MAVVSLRISIISKKNTIGHTCSLSSKPREIEAVDRLNYPPCAYTTRFYDWSILDNNVYCITAMSNNNLTRNVPRTILYEAVHAYTHVLKTTPIRF